MTAGVAAPPQMKRQAVVLYVAGHTTTQIGKKLGVSSAAVRRWLIDAGIPLRRKGRPSGCALTGGEWWYDPARGIKVWKPFGS